MKKQQLIQSHMLEPSRSGFEILGVFNPAVIKYDNYILMIARVAERPIQDEQDWYKVPIFCPLKGLEIKKISKQSSDYDFSDNRVIKNGKTSFLTSISHLRIGVSTDGVHFDFNQYPFILPKNPYEEYGMEDPRITLIENEFYITYTAVSRFGITVRLLKTKDFYTYLELGNIFHCDNKDCVIFPSLVNGKYFALHRPSISQFGQPDIWTAESPNLTDWGNHHILQEARVNYMRCSRVGAGAVPFLTEAGWVVIYHCADEQNRYHLASLLLDKVNPNIVLRRSKTPLIEPTEPYELEGFMKDVVFTCGLIQNQEDLHIYYGACDDSIAMCTLTMTDVFSNMEVLA